MAAEKPAKRAIFCLGYKGGTGKTTFARALLDRYRRDGLPALALDGDGRVGQLIQYYGTRDDANRLVQEQPVGGVQYFDARDPETRTRILDVLDRAPQRVLFDLPGGVMNEIGAAIGVNATASDVVAEYKKDGYAVTLALVLSPMLASARSVKDAMNAFGPDVDLLIVLNGFFGSAEPSDGDFLYWHGFEDGAGQRKGGTSRTEAVQRGAVEIVLPTMRSRVVAQLDAENLTYDAARSHATLPRSARRHIEQWMRETDQQLDKATKMLAL